MLYDTHCHIYFDTFEPLGESIAACRRAGMPGLVAIGIDLETTGKARRLAGEHEGFVHYSAGFHPTSEHPEAPAEQLEDMFSREPAPVAVGECGVDLHHDEHPVETQQELFHTQIEFAAERDLPVIVHQRKAGEEVLEVVREHPGVTFVFHCFDGDQGLLAWGREHGAYFGFAGTVTYGDEAIERAVRELDPGRLLIETDAPFLAPEPWRGWSAKPSMTVASAKRVADLRGTPLVELASQLNRNTERLFDLG